MYQNRQIFLRYIHNFRGLAILLIVIGHMLPFIDRSEHPLVSSLMHILVFNGSVYFIFIAGFLFQFLSVKFKYKIYLKNKFLNVIIPYILVSIPAICLCILKNQPFYPIAGTNFFSNWSLVHKVIYLYMTGSHFFHFWFIPMILIFYIFSPTFIWLDRHSQYYKILPFLLCLSILVPRAQDDVLVLQNFVHFISVYTLGMFCSHYQDRVLLFMRKYWQWVFLIAIMLVILELTLARISSSLANKLYINTTLKSILSVMFMYLLWRFDSVFPRKLHAVLGRIAELSFGIYFLHAYIIYAYMYALKYFNISVSKNFVFLAVSLVAIIFINIWILLLFQKNLPKRSRYIVGC